MNQNILQKLDSKYIQNMKNLLEKDYVLYEKSMEKTPVRGIRVNPIKMNKQKFISLFEYPVEAIPYEENGFVLDSTDKLGNSFLHMSGCVYLQEPSSMVPVSSLDVSRDAKVLDLCAAPGGKSTQVAVKIPDGVLVSNEIVTSRSRVLFSNLERLGVKNSVVLNETPEHIAKILEGYFDAVVVDAPCGGEGMFRKDPDTIGEWNEDRLSSNHERQVEILKHADKCLKTGGKLVYSTCTFSEIENEDVVLEFLKDYDYSVLEVPSAVKEWTRCGTKVKNARRFYPFSGKGEGQFVCVLQKNSGQEEWRKSSRSKVSELSKNDKQLVQKFLDQNFDIDEPFELIQLRENIMLVPSRMVDLSVSGLNIINIGVRVGTIEKGILKPHHQLFMAMGECSKFKYEMNNIEAQRYVHGEELVCEGISNGYYTMFVNGASIGGAKCSQGRLKNLYPKGLRI